LSRQATPGFLTCQTNTKAQWTLYNGVAHTLWALLPDGQPDFFSHPSCE
jgi:hypothetical protein